MLYRVYHFVLLTTFFTNVHCYKILGIFPTMSPSHFRLGSTLMKGLAKKGHEVTILAPFSIGKPVKNIRQVFTSKVLHEAKDVVGDIFTQTNPGIIESFKFASSVALAISNLTLSEQSVKDLLNSNESFDLIVLEGYATEGLLGMAHHFNAPVVVLTTFGALQYMCDMVGTPTPLSHVPHIGLPFSDRMSFPERMSNVFLALLEKLGYYYFYFPRQEALYNNFFLGPKPPLESLFKNISLVLLNSHFSVTYPRPYAINMIEVSGFHINYERQVLASDIQEFLDTAENGVIYFSLGSNVNTTAMPRNKRTALLSTFKSIKQRVLLKWEEATLPGKTDNILIKPWFPQGEILAHPNLKLFISHGGLLSIMETVYNAVPMIAIPIFGDTLPNTLRAEKAGYVMHLSLEELNEKSLKTAIKTILSNRTYTEKVQQASLRYRDRPQSPLDLAIYWVEYVARHNGAPHMKSGSQGLSFIEYHNLDVYAAVFVLLIIISIIIFALAFYIITKIISSKKIVDATNKVKVQ